jgi:hypothetical protein
MIVFFLIRSNVTQKVNGDNNLEIDGVFLSGYCNQYKSFRFFTEMYFLAGCS